jgi:hypothetical protein
VDRNREKETDAEEDRSVDDEKKKYHFASVL